MTFGYTWEVFFNATQGLATGSGRIQERLENVGSYLVGRIRPPLPMPDDELREKADSIMTRLTCVEAGPSEDGTLAATCRRLTDEEGHKIAEDIVSIFNTICQLYGAENDKKETEYRERQRKDKR